MVTALNAAATMLRNDDADQKTIVFIATPNQYDAYDNYDIDPIVDDGIKIVVIGVGESNDSFTDEEVNYYF